MISILKYGETSNDQIFGRMSGGAPVDDIVADIIKNVVERGDEALMEYADKFDGGRPETLEVSKEEWDEAVNSVEPEFLRIMERAAQNIREFHINQKRTGFAITRPGAVLGQKITPLQRVGLYVPGGTASYPSSVMMNCIPAKIAGVSEIVMVTPAKGGKLKPMLLAAARVAGVDRVFKMGGAQSVAALAYGTQSVPKVDKIVGPGNAFVAEAKRQVYGRVDIDMIAGPSEILIVADGKSNPKYLAADLLSQAEHDKLASAVLVTDSEELAKKVAEEVEKQLCALPREEIARPSIENNGKIIITPDIDTAIEIANELAPEHLELVFDDPFRYLDKVKNAGSIFMGRYCPEALGDYMSGPNHTLPTMGTAHFSSPLSVDDFVKKSQYSYFDADAFLSLADDVAYFADKEDLHGHAESVLKRLEDLRN